MKKVFALVFCLAMTIGFAQDANAWWWQRTEVKCEAKLIIKLGEGPAEVTFEQSWDGVKYVCRDGDSWCWSSDCS